MPTPVLTLEQIAYFAQQVSGYISLQRAAYLSVAVPIEPTHGDLLAAYFTGDLLARTRIALIGRPVENPPFYPTLKQMGFDNLPVFPTMAAITFLDLIVFQEAITANVLFHELVHSVQYSMLGLDGFSRLYVEGFLHCGFYEGIPLEINASQLEERFKATPKHLFSVEAEVQRWVDAGRF